MVKNKYCLLGMLLVMMLLTLMLTSCEKSEFGVTENSAKLMTITAEKADKSASVLAGTLEVADGEQIVITANLTKGSVKVEIIGVPAEQNIDELPEIDGEAVITANLKSTDSASDTVPAGSYQVRAACLETATGTVQIEVKPAE